MNDMREQAATYALEIMRLEAENAALKAENAEMREKLYEYAAEELSRRFYPEGAAC